LEDALDADRHIGEEGIAEVVDDHADDRGAGLAQIGRTTVVDIAQRLDRDQDFGPGLGLHHGAALEDEGDRRLRHPACRAMSMTVGLSSPRVAPSVKPSSRQRLCVIWIGPII
jgi:hypothetical protein